MKLPHFELEELKRLKEENFKQRLEFIDWHTNWLKKSSNKKWSSQQKNLIN
ncbi:hypothetical protein J4434_03165 [Candidatus Woesearchaeota archaeon]|nr:hypothetical protein [Candidatus Woesearchaeota archaeon]